MTKKPQLRSHDGYALHTNLDKAANERAVCVVVHGYAEHLGRYDYVTQSLNDNGITVFRYDHKGHGRSEGLKAYIADIYHMVNDLELIIQQAHKYADGKKLFIVAHSLGAGVSALYGSTIKNLVDGYILSAPPFKVSEDISPYLQKIAHFLGRIMPKVPIASAGGTSVLCSDPAVCDDFANDPLCYNGLVRASTGKEILRISAEIQGSLKNFSAPVLILHGTNDQLADISGSQLFYDQIPSQDKEFKKYQGMFHEIFNEVHRQKPLQDMTTWINTRLV
jgi:acylglycerol lipase